MPNHPISFLYRRDWPDDESDCEDNLENGFENDFENDQVMDGFFGGGGCKPPEKKPECGEPPEKPPASSEPQKPEPGKSCKCKAKKKSASKKSSCKRSIKKSKSSCKKRGARKAAKKMKRDKCGGGDGSGGSRIRLSRNPFIIFFLLMLQKQKNKRAADVAREAGKKWCCMDDKSKEAYQKLAHKERMRRKMASKGKKQKSHEKSEDGCVAKKQPKREPKAKTC